MNEQLVLLTAIFSAIATALAAFATWRAPMSAAKLAEALRRDAERDSERRRQKLNVFSTLMEERAQIHSDNGVRALNLVDIVFSDSREVRDAWAELYAAFSFKPLVPHVINERLIRLLGAIAKDIGLAVIYAPMTLTGSIVLLSKNKINSSEICNVNKLWQGCRAMRLEQAMQVHLPLYGRLGRNDSGGPGVSRTRDPSFRKRMLYPSELRGLQIYYRN